MEVKNGLIIKKKWAEKILNNEKSWEIRGQRTIKRGTIGIIISGTKKIYGTCELYDCIGPLSIQEMLDNENKHLIKQKYLLEEGMPYKKTYTWCMRNAKYYDEPIEYEHPLGAIIWVKL